MSARLAAPLRPLCLALAAASAPAFAAGDYDLQELREQVRQLKESYEQRIEALERRLAAAEKAAAQPAAAPPAADQSAAAPVPERGKSQASTDSAFNPAISLILSGTYTDLSQDPASYEITGFVPSLGETAPPPRSFSLGESELTLSANIDPWFRGYFTAALTPENEVEVEEAYFQTLALGNGLSVKGGRFFSGVGYLNELHPHSWDFADAPLAYKAFFGNQLGGDGVQLKWVAPTDLYLEAGIEGARYLSFPANDSERNKNGLMSGAGFLRLGGDAGASNSWRTGLSYVRTEVSDRTFESGTSFGISENAFSGDSETWIADFVWKWAPNGNAAERNFKLQGEYFWREERGALVSSLIVGDDESYSSRQSGWYLQGVYQFMPRWRVGLRYDSLDSGDVNIGLVSSGALTLDDLAILRPHNPERATAMVDWSPSEFSRLRLQYARDESRAGVSDSQLWVQYIMSLGAHGAHRY